jgi:hypothetical protein
VGVPTKTSAKIICEKIKCDFEIVDDIREHNVHGIMSGVNKDLAKEIFGFWLNSDKYKNYYNEGRHFYGGEPESEFAASIS